MEIITPRTGFHRNPSPFFTGFMVTGLLILCAQAGILSQAKAQERPATTTSSVAQADAVKAVSSRPPQSQWLDRVAEFFRYPIVYVALIALGLIGLIFEFKFPGTTFPGSVAAVCFVLFFWAHSFVGEFTLLAILLFLLGLVFLGVEVCLVPGIGFVGVAGAVLMFISLLLVTVEHWPDNQDDWMHLGSTFGTLSVGLVLAVAGALALTWSLPNIPLLNRMVLKPPGEVEDHEAATAASSMYANLLGAIGVAVTPLRPSGKAQFGGQFLDVMAEGGDFVSPGGRVQIVEIEGVRIIVREV